jgi:hypothetical protein
MATTEKTPSIDRDDSMSNIDTMSTLSDGTDITVSNQLKAVTSIQQFLAEIENEMQDISNNILQEKPRESKKESKSQN